MAAVPYTVSIDEDLVKEFKRVCRQRGRSQSFYVTACMKRVVGRSKSVDLPARPHKGQKTRRRVPDNHRREQQKELE